jgi:hypothetical protein
MSLVLLPSVRVAIQGFALVIEFIEFLQNVTVIKDYVLNDLYASLSARAGTLTLLSLLCIHQPSGNGFQSLTLSILEFPKCPRSLGTANLN